MQPVHPQTPILLSTLTPCMTPLPSLPRPLLPLQLTAGSIRSKNCMNILMKV